MITVGLRTLWEFAEKHSDVRSQISSWIREVEEAVWSTPNDIKARFASASFLAEKTVVFNLKGNKYRLVTKISFKTQHVIVKWIGTHADYSKRKL